MSGALYTIGGNFGPASWSIEGMYRTLAVRDDDEPVLLANVRRADRRHRTRVAVAVCLSLGFLAIAYAAIEHRHLARPMRVRRLPPAVPVATAQPEPLRVPGSGHRRTRVILRRIEPLEVRSSGTFQKDVVPRIVRQNFGRFRLCYENGLRDDQALEGVVSIKFVIDRSGAVSLAQDAGSTLPNPGVVACIARAFTNLSFPQPENGIAVVTYTLRLQTDSD